MCVGGGADDGTSGLSVVPPNHCPPPAVPPPFGNSYPVLGLELGRSRAPPPAKSGH